MLIGLLALPWQQHAELQEFYEDTVSWDSGNFPGSKPQIIALLKDEQPTSVGMQRMGESNVILRVTPVGRPIFNNQEMPCPPNGPNLLLPTHRLSMHSRAAS